MTVEKSGEFRGKTVDAAISAGLAALRLSRAEVEVEVVRPGSRGVLGLGAEDAVVRLTSVQPARTETRAAARPEPRPEPRPATPPAPRSEPKPAPAVTPAPAAAQPAQNEADAPIAAPSGDDKLMVGALKGQELLSGLLQRMNIRATVEVVPQSEAEVGDDERTLVLNIVGDDLGMLIGRQNETLAAMEFITRLMVNQQTRMRTSFVVDVNGYRAKRAEALRKLALRMADQAMQSGRTMTLEPMPPAERRIIHLTLREHASVSTQSVGEGDRRKVTIVPRKS